MNIVEFIFRACREAGNITFTIDKCQLTGQVNNIHTALIGFSGEWNATDDSPKCSSKVNGKCEVDIKHREEIVKCNGKPNCSFSQGVLSHSPYNHYHQRCLSSTERNFIYIEYSCIDGKKSVCDFCHLRLFINVVTRTPYL